MTNSIGAPWGWRLGGCGEGMVPPHLVRAFLCASSRGIVTGIYTTSSPEACQYIAHDCRANVIVVDTQKQLEKILKVWREGKWVCG